MSSNTSWVLQLPIVCTISVMKLETPLTKFGKQYMLHIEKVYVPMCVSDQMSTVWSGSQIALRAWWLSVFVCLFHSTTSSKAFTICSNLVLCCAHKAISNMWHHVADVLHNVLQATQITSRQCTWSTHLALDSKVILVNVKLFQSMVTQSQWFDKGPSYEISYVRNHKPQQKEQTWARG